MYFKYLPVLFFALFSTVLFGQFDIPHAVNSAFFKKFPATKTIDVAQENDAFEFEFEINGQSMSSNFSDDGTWLETEWEMDIDDLPDNIKLLLANRFSAYELIEADKISSWQLDLGYELELKSNRMIIEILVNEDAGIIKRKIESEDDDKDVDPHNK